MYKRSVQDFIFWLFDPHELIIANMLLCWYTIGMICGRKDKRAYCQRWWCGRKVRTPNECGAWVNPGRRKSMESATENNRHFRLETAWYGKGENVR